MGVHARDARARGVHLFATRARLKPRHAFLRGPHAVARAPLPLPGDVHSGLRLVSLSLRSRVGLQQRLEPLQVRFGDSQLRVEGRDIRVRGRHLRLGLADVLRPGDGLQEARLGVGGRALRAGTYDLQFHVARVEPCDEVAARQAIALVCEQLRIRPPISADT